MVGLARSIRILGAALAALLTIAAHAAAQQAIIVVRHAEKADQTPDTEGVREVTRRVMQSDDWIASIVPIRDGVLIAYKR